MQTGQDAKAAEKTLIDRTAYLVDYLRDLVQLGKVIIGSKPISIDIDEKTDPKPISIDEKTYPKPSCAMDVLSNNISNCTTAIHILGDQMRRIDEQLGGSPTGN